MTWAEERLGESAAAVCRELSVQTPCIWLGIYLFTRSCPFKLLSKIENRFSLTANSAVAWNGLLPFTFGGCTWLSERPQDKIRLVHPSKKDSFCMVPPETSGHPLWALWWACLTSTKSTKESPNQVDFLTQMFGTGKVVLPHPNKIQNFIQLKKAEKCQIPLRWANMFFLDLHDFFVWESFAGLQFCRWTEVNRTRSLVNNNLVLRPKISSTLKFRSHVLLRCILTSIVFVLLCMVPCANRAHGFYWCMCGGIRKSSHKLKYPKKMVFPQRRREKKAYAKSCTLNMVNRNCKIKQAAK